MLPYLLILVIFTGRNSVATVQQPMPTEQVCTAVEQDIIQQSTNNGAYVISKGCYDTSNGGNH